MDRVAVNRWPSLREIRTVSRGQVDRRPGTDVQPHHTGLDQLLWPLLQVGTLSDAPPPRPAPCALGDGEIQTPATASTASRALDQRGCLARSSALCSLAAAASGTDWTVRAG